ncbi:energy-coupling factor transporter ATP-binding protein EcfA2 [Mycolicibacterium iranicum]|uniref:Energy-coupling factor transporter ATP-binding protein EcfA2 n=1 Tax=Mycolicibacterium iranicum TaxID=912594 RepID=A0A839QFU8_MYCIR|nr:ATP-binding protein [Mycolicibacterium iranicum]MBB2993385.1 energy-coupling factor transporter ATP-binding protein EcfA2 [Mycolicibacterium iranicum]
MKLHRLVLTNYRGITHRDIEFPDRGVVVISGANEVGKSSMLEALDLLLEAKDRSTKKEIKQVKPTHADVGAEVTAEISAGPYRFVYRKRFHKKPETELTVSAPRREQLTGDEAHERVRAMLAETVDLDLWQAQRVLQSAPTTAADLSGCDALSRALDVVAGAVDDDPTPGGAVDTLLIDRIEEEYRRYFTSTGRPTGEWAAATARLRAADGEVARCAAAIAEVDEAVRRHAALTAELAATAEETSTATAALAVTAKAAEQVALLQAELDQATARAEVAVSTYAASRSALTERRRIRADIEERTATIARLHAESEVAADDLDTATQMKLAADEAAESARLAVSTSQQRLDAARSAVQRLADREELDRVAGRLATLERHHREFEVIERELATITLTDRLMTAVEHAAAAVERAAAAVEQTSAHLELAAMSDVQLSVDGQVVSLRAGDTWAGGISAATGVDVPGVLSLRVSPGASATATQAGLDAATDALTKALRDAGVADVEAARSLDRRRHELRAARQQVRAILDALTGDDSIDDLRTRISALQERLPAEDALFDPTGPATLDPAAQRLELIEATAAHQEAVRDCETHRKVAEEAGKLLTQRGLHAARLTAKLQAAQSELVGAGARLSEQRAAVGDDELAVKTEEEAEAARKAEALVAQLAEDVAAHQPAAVAAALAAAERDLAAVTARRDAVTESLRDVAAQLKVFGTEGRKGELDAAETERERAEAEFVRVQRRARAADLLRSVMGRHRDAVRQRYVDPFRGEVERLGRIVFGESFEVDVDSTLSIGHRTLSGRTVPYDSLSGGAKEQLSIVARLAGAALVAKEDSVPVVIDDALGFTDAERLTKMAEVFDAVAGDGQVIILTCSPQRYADVRSARHIELVAG